MACFFYVFFLLFKRIANELSKQGILCHSKVLVEYTIPRIPTILPLRRHVTLFIYTDMKLEKKVQTGFETFPHEGSLSHNELNVF